MSDGSVTVVVGGGDTSGNSSENGGGDMASGNSRESIGGTRNSTQASGTATQSVVTQAGSETPYRQKYKRAWELDIELRDWIQPCTSDAHAAWCKYCRSKLHAHKKGLLAHSRSAKHKKHVLNPASADMNTSLSESNYTLNPQMSMIQSQDQSRFPATITPTTSTAGDDSNILNLNNSEHLNNQSTNIESQGQSQRRSHLHQFNNNWLVDPIFSHWVRKIPSNNTKALCIACRCVITAGRSELLKHSQSAKHKKAVLMGPFEELNAMDLEFLEQTYNQQQQQQNHDPHSSSLNSSIQFQSQHYLALHQNQIQSQCESEVLLVNGLLLDEIVNLLNQHVPLSLAESWDNVGMMVRPTTSLKVHNILLTIDLNEQIVEEAIRKRCQMIISYHPPIFKALKHIIPSNWKEKSLLMCIENRIAVYSPHTALDAMKGGINDWLLSAFCPSLMNLVQKAAFYSMSSVTQNELSGAATTSSNISSDSGNNRTTITTSTHSGRSEKKSSVITTTKTPNDVPTNGVDPDNCSQNTGRTTERSSRLDFENNNANNNQAPRSTVSETDDANLLVQTQLEEQPMEIQDHHLRPIQYSREKSFTASLELMLADNNDGITQQLQSIDNVLLTVRHTNYGGSDLRLACDESTLPQVLDVLHQHPYAHHCSRVTHLMATPIPGVGMGRLLTLKSPLPLYEVVHRTKQHLDQTNVRLGLSPQHTRDTKVSRIAVCAGSGTSVLRDCVGQADVWITGEMSHHDVLDATRSGATVILCEHSNTERGYLRHWAQSLKTDIFANSCNVIVSEFDRDPLKIV